MYRMFGHAAAFNRPLDMWDVSRIKNFMFAGAASFNQPATLKRFGLVLPFSLLRTRACRLT
jgi:hypothetical protein